MPATAALFPLFFVTLQPMRDGATRFEKLCARCTGRMEAGGIVTPDVFHIVFDWPDALPGDSRNGS